MSQGPQAPEVVFPEVESKAKFEPAYVKLPAAIIEALETGAIDRLQFEILTLCYKWARRDAYKVYSYSAERVCRALGLDANTANLKQFQRAMRNLVERNIVQYDYEHGRERTYCVWVPRPERFERIGEAEENKLSLWNANVAVPVAVRDATTTSIPMGYGKVAAALVAENVEVMSITNQEACGSKLISPERTPTPERGIAPSAPVGERSNGAGLLKAATVITKTRALTPEQCKLLKEAALHFCSFFDSFYNFTPDRKAAERLLRHYAPQEILFAVERKFPCGDFKKTDMNYFLQHGAETLMQAARLEGTSDTRPKCFKGFEDSRCDATVCKELWQRAVFAWKKIGIAVSSPEQQAKPAMEETTC